MKNTFYERIKLKPVTTNKNSNYVEISVESISLFAIYTNTDSRKKINSRDLSLYTLFDTFHLQNLYVTISDWSSSEWTYSRNKSKSSTVWPMFGTQEFLAGTLVRYQHSLNFTQFPPPFATEHNENPRSLLRALSGSGILCNSQSLETMELLYMMEETILINPRQHHPLCRLDYFLQNILSYSKSPYSSIIKKSMEGIFANLHAEGLKGDNIIRKASWVHAKRLISNKKSLWIHHGFRYLYLLPGYTSTVPLHTLMGYGNMTLDYMDLTVKACPWSEYSYIHVQEGQNDKIYDIHNQSINVTLSIDTDFKPLPNDSTQPVLGIERVILGNTRFANDGTFETRIYSNGRVDCTVNASIVELYPNVIRPLLQTLKISLVHGEGAGDERFQISPSIYNYSNVTDYEINDLVKKSDINLSIVKDKDSPARLSLSNLSLPSDSSLYITIEYQYRFIPVDKFQSDPYRGFDVLPSYVKIFPPYSLLSQGPIRLYSNPLLIMIPVPDMSMPFNVLFITSTFYAMVIGFTMNILIRKATRSINDDLKQGDVLKEKMKKRN